VALPALALLAVFFAAGCSGSSPTAPTPPPPVIVQPQPVVVVPPQPNPLLSDSRFDLGFYRQLALDGFQTPSLRSLNHWTRAPLIYIRTVDDAGRAVARSLLEQTAAAIINTTGQWTGGRFGVAGLEQGTDTKEGQPGWLTVKWNTTGPCGTTNGVVGEGSAIVMNHARPECTCGPRVAKHELGHAMGFYHTDSIIDVMSGLPDPACDKNPSAREVFHAQVAYGQPLGSRDPS